MGVWCRRGPRHTAAQQGRTHVQSAERGNGRSGSPLERPSSDAVAGSLNVCWPLTRRPLSTLPAERRNRSRTASREPPGRSAPRARSVTEVQFGKPFTRPIQAGRIGPPPGKTWNESIPGVVRAPRGQQGDIRLGGAIGGRASIWERSASSRSAGPACKVLKRFDAWAGCGCRRRSGVAGPRGRGPGRQRRVPDR